MECDDDRWCDCGPLFVYRISATIKRSISVLFWFSCVRLFLFFGGDGFISYCYLFSIKLTYSFHFFDWIYGRTFINFACTHPYSKLAYQEVFSYQFFLPLKFWTAERNTKSLIFSHIDWDSSVFFSQFENKILAVN